MRLISLLFIIAPLAAIASDFNKCFTDSTLRLDYIFSGDGSHTAIYLDGLAKYNGWAGRRNNLSKPFLGGNGQVTVTDPVTADTLYTNTFSTLFQEWQCTDEAANVSRAFESTYLVPFPKAPVDVTVALYDNRHRPVASLTHRVDPEDILIRRIPENSSIPVRVIREGDNPGRSIDIAILAEGYTADETEKFFADAERAADAIFSHEPFESMAGLFRVVAVAAPSMDSGTSVPREDLWLDTAFKSHFDTFYSDRYLTTQSVHDIYDALGAIPVEHVIVIVNTPRYGGGGIFNQLTIATSDHPTFKQVLVHEFGHAYGGLADEYFYADDSDATYPVDVEPWEPNITTLVDFSSKWQDMLPDGVRIPTPIGDMPDYRTLDRNDRKDAKLLYNLSQDLGVYEGAGYKAHGIYRPTYLCRMRVNEGDHFCPVCTRDLINITRWYTE